MCYVMQTVNSNTVVVIDAYEALSGGADWPDSTWPQESPWAALTAAQQKTRKTEEKQANGEENGKYLACCCGNSNE